MSILGSAGSEAGDLLDADGRGVRGCGNTGSLPDRTIPVAHFAVRIASDGGYRSMICEDVWGLYWVAGLLPRIPEGSLDCIGCVLEGWIRDREFVYLLLSDPPAYIDYPARVVFRSLNKKTIAISSRERG